MKNNKLSPTFADWTVLIKAGVAGILIAQAWIFSQCNFGALQRLINLVPESQKNNSLIIAIVFIIILFAIYWICRNGHFELAKLIHSMRVDLLIMFAIGIKLSDLSKERVEPFYKFFSEFFRDREILTIYLLPIVIFFLLVLKTGKRRYFLNKEKTISPFLVDVELSNLDDDLLNFKKNAEQFAGLICAGTYSESIVFGIDAPWGIGKSSFVNFLCQFLEKSPDQEVIVYKFNPLKYESNSNLIQKFLEGLVISIQKKCFVPELQPLASRYQKYLRGKVSLSFLGITYDPATYDVDDAFKDLGYILSGLDKKIIVIVDDLDRISHDAIKEVLSAIKKSFSLPNVCYVLCYDTENIVRIEINKKGQELANSIAPANNIESSNSENKVSESDKIRESLEKFINVKIGIYLEKQVLKEYIGKNFEKIAGANRYIDPQAISLFLRTISDMLDSTDYEAYQFFLGDIRKIKRLINAITLLDLNKTDFENSDFSIPDIVHLLLIYVNFPNIFRKIYTLEVDSKKGFFRANYFYEHDEGRFINSNEYLGYIETLSFHQKFVLNKIFLTSERFSGRSVTEKESHICACFNGDSTGRNLERHLQLIVKMHRPSLDDQYLKHFNAKDKYIKNVNDDLDQVFASQGFSFDKGEVGRREVFRILVNSTFEFPEGRAHELIKYITSHIDEYSLLSIPEIGLERVRQSLIYYLILLLDKTGYTDGKHQNNSDENVVKIADWIFGEGSFIGMGISDELASSKNILGFVDLLNFRLSCSANRNGNCYNLYRGLYSKEKQTTGSGIPINDLTINGLRKFSQYTFSVFSKRYIDGNINVFDEIDKLTLENMSGKYHQYAVDKTKGNIISLELLEKQCSIEKNNMKSFVIYQLGNSIVDFGVGCGYYDPNGASDTREISNKINDYLFNHCFNPQVDSKNYQHFLNFMLLNFKTDFMKFGVDGVRKLDILGLLNVLSKEKLMNYWSVHKDHIRNAKFETTDNEICNSNGAATYKNDLADVFKALDDLVNS